MYSHAEPVPARPAYNYKAGGEALCASHAEPVEALCVKAFVHLQL